MAIALTPREYQVLAAAAEGLTRRQIGRRLSISPHTVQRHRLNVSEKCGGGGLVRSFLVLGWLRVPRYVA